MKVYFCRITVILRRLLEIHTIRKHMTIDPGVQYFSALMPPMRSKRGARKDGSNVEKPQRFTSQMCVGTKVSGKVSFDMPAADLQSGRQPLKQDWLPRRIT